MALYHLSAKIIGRQGGRRAEQRNRSGRIRMSSSNAVAAAAYRSGDKLHDDRTGSTYRYARADRVVHKEIIASAEAPVWSRDRSQLWNAVEARERRKDAQLARELEIALPVELDLDQQRALVCNWITTEFVSAGAVADVAIHHDRANRNPHAHVMTTMRSLDARGWSRQKLRQWEGRSALANWRTSWADHVNLALERAGHQARVDHRSYAEQDAHRPEHLRREPTQKIGPWAAGGDRELENRCVRARNHEITQRVASENLQEEIGPATERQQAEHEAAATEALRREYIRKTAEEAPEKTRSIEEARRELLSVREAAEARFDEENRQESNRKAAKGRLELERQPATETDRKAEDAEQEVEDQGERAATEEAAPVVTGGRGGWEPSEEAGRASSASRGVSKFSDTAQPPVGNLTVVQAPQETSKAGEVAHQHRVDSQKPRGGLRAAFGKVAAFFGSKPTSLSPAAEIPDKEDPSVQADADIFARTGMTRAEFDARRQERARALGGKIRERRKAEDEEAAQRQEDREAQKVKDNERKRGIEEFWKAREVEDRAALDAETRRREAEKERDLLAACRRPAGPGEVTLCTGTGYELTVPRSLVPVVHFLMERAFGVDAKGTEHDQRERQAWSAIGGLAERLRSWMKAVRALLIDPSRSDARSRGEQVVARVLEESRPREGRPAVDKAISNALSRQRTQGLGR